MRTAARDRGRAVAGMAALVRGSAAFAEGQRPEPDANGEEVE